MAASRRVEECGIAERQGWADKKALRGLKSSSSLPIRITRTNSSIYDEVFIVKIENEGVRRVLGRYVEQAEMGKSKDTQEKKSEPSEADEVVVSDRARELQRIHQRLDEIVSARRAKVEAIRQDIEAGTYRTTGDMVARKIVGSR